MITPIETYIRSLKGPIVVLGAGGFIGVNLLRMLLATRQDVFGVVKTLPAWRLADIDRRYLLETDMLSLAAIRSMIAAIRPATVFDMVAYGAYSFETVADLIYRTNFVALTALVNTLAEADAPPVIVHAGSSSEYGTNCAAPSETDMLLPNSDYAVSKAAASQFIHFAGRIRNIPIINLRLYSAYGPYEDTSRLIPALVTAGLKGQFPQLVNAETSRDFIYVDDACEAFIVAAAKLTPDLYGSSLNIGSGHRTTIRDIAAVAAEVFEIGGLPVFDSMPQRRWDLADWYADTRKAEAVLGWRATTTLADGLRKTASWIQTLTDEARAVSTKKNAVARRSISAIIACYKDEPAIPIMHQRLSDVFQKLKVDYEIIFVNDGSPDRSAEIIRDLSRLDPHVLGITHSRNFGSQMAFRSGMEMSIMQSVVLLDGDLQDPPELIETFYEKWLEGFQVIYGRRVKRDMPVLWGLAYKAFYRIFAWFSYVQIPHDAGDFSLIDRRVVGWLLNSPERDLFLRGLRAFVGFRQAGVDYVRPKRMFGESTNNLLKNLEWAKRGIFSFSNVPLKMLSAAGLVLLFVAFLAGLIVTLLRLFIPDIAPRGATTLLLMSLFFGSLNLFAIGIVGEYVAKIMEEVKARPRLIRAALIRDGEVSELLPDGSVRQ